MARNVWQRLWRPPRALFLFALGFNTRHHVDQYAANAKVHHEQAALSQAVRKYIVKDATGKGILLLSDAHR